MDLQKLRRRSFVRTTLDMVERFGVNDQLAIHLYTRGEFKALDPAWNVFAGQETSGAPHIIHWPGAKKPWNTYDVAFKNVWDAYARGYDPMRRWIGALLGRWPVNSMHRFDPRSMTL
jgi:lipopolysaccharide biosynthesis glycosyltransferase